MSKPLAFCQVIATTYRISRHTAFHIPYLHRLIQRYHLPDRYITSHYPIHETITDDYGPSYFIIWKHDPYDFSPISNARDYSRNVRTFTPISLIEHAGGVSNYDKFPNNNNNKHYWSRQCIAIICHFFITRPEIMSKWNKRPYSENHEKSRCSSY